MFWIHYQGRSWQERRSGPLESRDRAEKDTVQHAYIVEDADDKEEDS
jgi:hypothetical protein